MEPFTKTVIRVAARTGFFPSRSCRLAAVVASHAPDSLGKESAIVCMHPVSSGFEEWIHLFVQDSFGQKKQQTLPGAIVIRAEPIINLAQSCDSTNQIVVSTFRHQLTETRPKFPDSFPTESGARETTAVAYSPFQKIVS